MKLKVKEHPGLVRDSRSKAIINIDNDSRQEYQNKRLLQEKIQRLSSDVESLKGSIKNIEEMLLTALKRN